MSREARRYESVGKRKSAGSTYTPAAFAEFVASRMLADFVPPEGRPLRVLDPACGDGALLEALLMALPIEARQDAEVVGFDTDPAAVAATAVRLQSACPTARLRIEVRDFLELVLTLNEDGCLRYAESAELFDLVIANPPYVRTQILGATVAQQLAKDFGFTGRVDLYFPFLIGISRVLDPQGVAGVIVSNRFMTTRAGQVVRRQLLSRFRMRHVWDLGDTKLFDAAVLPALLLADGSGASQRDSIGLSSIYECDHPPETHAHDVLAALNAPSGTVVQVSDGRRFKVLHGTLENGGDPTGVWRVATGKSDAWLATVEANTWGRFSDIGKIRVGVKTTADKVFIRADWKEMPDEDRPELLRPLTTRHCARRFKALEPDVVRQVLYPHESCNEGRSAVDLGKYPKSARYLEQHRSALQARRYVIDAGRKWYEIWVPHDPAAWLAPKLIFLDISEKPTFWIDTSGTVVSGECYWLKCNANGDLDLLWLAMAVANSTFVEEYYDHRFSNKLYAGRRRFMTQYVEQFPLPQPSSDSSRQLIQLAKTIYSLIPSEKSDQLSAQLDVLVWTAFGLSNEEVLRKRYRHRRSTQPRVEIALRCTSAT